MRFVPIKNVEQQAIPSMHRVNRDLLKPKLRQTRILEDAENSLPGTLLTAGAETQRRATGPWCRLQLTQQERHYLLARRGLDDRQELA